MIIGQCFVFNLGTIALLLNGFEITTFTFKREYRWFWAIFLLGMLAWYYMYKNRYKRITAGDNFKLWKSIVIVVLYYGLSFGALLISGMFKNHDWIFQNSG